MKIVAEYSHQVWHALETLLCYYLHKTNRLAFMCSKKLQDENTVPQRELVLSGMLMTNIRGVC